MSTGAKGMTPEQVEELREQAEAALASVGGVSGPKGEQMDCLRCGMTTSVLRKGNAWEVECRCGWSAAGSSPRRAN